MLSVVEYRTCSSSPQVALEAAGDDQEVLVECLIRAFLPTLGWAVHTVLELSRLQRVLYVIVERFVCVRTC